MDVDTDEKKPFDAELGAGGADDDREPDPEEVLNLDQGNGRVWMVKVRFLPFHFRRFTTLL